MNNFLICSCSCSLLLALNVTMISTLCSCTGHVWQRHRFNSLLELHFVVAIAFASALLGNTTATRHLLEQNNAYAGKPHNLRCNTYLPYVHLTYVQCRHLSTDVGHYKVEPPNPTAAADPIHLSPMLHISDHNWTFFHCNRVHS